MVDTGHWIAQGFELDPAGAIGFVYLIVDKTTKQKYIGKKNFAGRGKKNKGVESNWREYCSSSTLVKKLIEEKGKDAFLFLVLEQYYTLGGLSFAETWTQVVCEIPSNNEEFLNRFIDKVTWKVTEPVTLKHRARLKSFLRKYKYDKV